ncbi:MAG: DUF2279 domain-containing protein [Leucothrix sp.]
MMDLRQVLGLLFLLSVVGCSNNATIHSGDSTALTAKKSNTRYMREAVAVGAVSVALGSLALGDVDRDFKTTKEGWFEKDSKYAGMDKLGHAWYGSAIADFFYERNPNKETQAKSSAALASAISLGIMSLVEVSDGFADNIVGFSREDMVANAVGAGFSYVRNTNPRLKKLVDFRIEYLPDYSADDWSIDTFYADQKYLLAWKLSGIDALKNNPARFFELHTGYYARGYSSKEFGDEKQRNGYIGIGLNLSEIFSLSQSEKRRSKRVAKHFLEHIQLPKTSVEASKSY